MRLILAFVLTMSSPAFAAASSGAALVDRLLRVDSDLRAEETWVAKRRQTLEANADSEIRRFFAAKQEQWRKNHVPVCVDPRLEGETQVRAAKDCLAGRYDDRLTSLGWATFAGVHPLLSERVVVHDEMQFRAVAAIPQFQFADGTPFLANAEIEAVASNRLEQARALWDEWGHRGKTGLYTAGIYYRMTYPSVRLMNIRMRMNEGEGLRPPGTWYQYQMLVDLWTGKLVPLDDVFVSGWRDRLTDLLYRRIVAENADRQLGTLDRAQLRNLVIDERRYRFWSDDFLVLIYDGELGAYTCAAQDTQFQFDETESLIRSDGPLRKDLRRPRPKPRGAFFDRVITC